MVQKDAEIDIAIFILLILTDIFLFTLLAISIINFFPFKNGPKH